MSDIVSLLGVQNTMPGAAEFQPPPAPAGRSPRSTVARFVTSRFSLSLSPRSLSCPVLSSRVLSCLVLSSPVLSCPLLSCLVLHCPVLSSPVLSLWSAFVWPTSVQSLWSRMEMVRLVERLRGFSQRETDKQTVGPREREFVCMWEGGMGRVRAYEDSR